jgi:hypothetical protein
MAATATYTKNLTVPFSVGSFFKDAGIGLALGAAVISGGPGLVLGGLALGSDIGGGIASGDSAGSIAASALVDTASLGVGGGLYKAGKAGVEIGKGTERAVNTAAFAANVGTNQCIDKCDSDE